MKTCSLVILMTVCFTHSVPTLAQHLIPRSVMANGGNTGANTQFRMVGTIGQTATGLTSNTTFALNAGFWGQVQTTPVAVESPFEDLPETFQLDQNFPNPFNPTTTIRFALPGESAVRLEIFNTIGQRVRVLLDNESPMSAGWHSIQWNGLDDAFRPAASGIYFYRLHAAKFVETKRMILVK